MKQVYKIKSNLRFPMAIAGLLGIPILYDVFNRGLPTAQIVLVSILMIIFYILTINNLVRRVITYEDNLDIITYLGKTNLNNDIITSVDGYTMGTRQFIILNADKKSYFIQNSFIGFPDIIQDILKIVPSEKIKEGMRDIQHNPLNRTRDVMTAWITVAIMTAILLRIFI